MENKIVEVLKPLVNSDFFVDDIPSKKLNNAINSYEIPEEENVIAIIDATVFGSAKNGLAITLNGLYWNNDWTTETKIRKISWRDFNSDEIKPIAKNKLQICKGGILDLTGSNVNAAEAEGIILEAFSVVQKFGFKEEDSSVLVKEPEPIENTSNHAQSTDLIVEDTKEHEALSKEEDNDIDDSGSDFSNIEVESYPSDQLPNSINLFIKEYSEKIASDIYISGHSNEKKLLSDTKLNNAIMSYGAESDVRHVIALRDATVFGSGKDGFYLTGTKLVCYKNGTINYSDIKEVNLLLKKEDKADGSEKITKMIKLVFKDNKEAILKGMHGGINHEEFVKFLNTITTHYDNYTDEDQLKALEDMSNEIKSSYLKIIINMTLEDDGVIDEKEMTEIMLLMTRLKLSSDLRFEIRSYISSMMNSPEVEVIGVNKLVGIIKEKSESTHFQSIMVSLVKDLFNVHMSAKGDNSSKIDFIEKYKDLFGVTDDQIQLAFDAVVNDYKILDEDLDDNAIKKSMQELAAKAGAVGTPLAAIYISGSVMGMSAAGITSGLATLGLGMGMSGGLVVVGLISIAAYKGVKNLTGANERDKQKTRELMLNEVIKQNQKTISLLIEDINSIVIKLNQALNKNNRDEEEIKKLTSLVMQFQKVMTSVDHKADVYTNKVNRISSPKELDVNRLKQLTDEPTKKPLFDFIIENYEEKSITKTTSEREQTVTIYTLKQDIPTEIIERMGSIFDKIGYFDIEKIVKSKLKGFFN